MVSDNLAAAIAYTGAALAAIGTLGAAWLQTRNSKTESRGQAADLMTEGYSALADRIHNDNIRLRKALVVLLEAEAQHKHLCNHGDLIITAAVTAAEHAIIET